ncbi:hypothetical protein LSAT2_007886 [Lamellibrachia satsuma]|nr:hypothetical protein LSAT2_007886 [Lamellibrachia satsuma]
MFDINPTYMNDIILVHGEAENAANGETFIGPCYISNKIERLLLIPGRTDKHVIIIVPREPGMGGPMANAGDTSGMNIALPRTERLQSVWSSKGLCLRHSSVQRASLEKKMSEQVLDKV